MNSIPLYLQILLSAISSGLFALGVVLLLIAIGNPRLKHSMDEQSERAEREQGPEGE